MNQITSRNKKGRVLVVNDHQFFCSALRGDLKDTYHVEMALDGESALAIAPRFRPHVALLDFYLPGYSGADVVKRLRTITPETVSILSSAVYNPRITALAVSIGAQDFFRLDRVETDPGSLHACVDENFRKWPRKQRNGVYPDSVDIPGSGRVSIIGDGNDLATFFDPDCFQWWLAMEGFVRKIVNGALRGLKKKSKMDFDEIWSDVSTYLISHYFAPLQRFDSSRANFRQWMTVIVKSRMLTAIDKIERHPWLSLEQIDRDLLDREVASSKSDPALVIPLQEQAREVKDFIAELPEDERSQLQEEETPESKLCRKDSDQNPRRKPSERTMRRRRKTGWIRVREWYRRKFGEE